MSPRWPVDLPTRLSRRLLRLLAWWMVPEVSSRSWLEEWEAELWQLRVNHRGWGALMIFLAGAVWHGLWEWKEGWTVESIVHDVRFAFRTLLRSPGFTAAAVLILGLSIGANTALFSVLEQAILTEPPYPEPDRIVSVDLLFGLEGEERRPNRWSYARFQGLEEEVASLVEHAGYTQRTATLTDLGDPRVVSVEAVTPGTFQLLGVSSSLGRLFDDSEVDRGVPILSTVVSEAFWRTEMGGSRDALGSLITLDGSRFQVVGVAADGFRGVTGQAELWIPFAALRAIENDGMIDDPWNLHFRVLARLAPGVTLEAARAEVQAFGATQRERYPGPVAAQRVEIGADVVPLAEARVNPLARTSMLALFTAVVLVLLVATANLAGLMLARGANRQREASIRASLGAGGSRLLRQMLTESLTLAFVGGAVGVIVAWFGVDLIAASLGDALSTSSGRGLVYLDTASLTIDTRLLVFAFVLTAGVGVALGVLPAVQLARTNPISAIKGGEMTGGLLQRVQGGLGRNTMLVVQVTVALVLVVGASLMMRSMAALQRVDLGFRPDNLLTAVYGITPADEDAGLDPALLHVDFAERVRSLPGVTGVALGTVPMGGPSWATVIDGSDGDPEITPSQHVWMQLQPVDAGHLEVLGAQLVEGRDIEATDDWNTDRVIVINRSAARRLFPSGNPIGRRIRFSWSGYGNPGALVVGIAEDVQLTSPEAAVPLQAYLAVRQSPRLESGIMVRTSGDPEQLIPALRQALSEIAPTVALTSVMTMEERVSGLTAQSRIVTTVLGLFGAVSLLLVAVGLYGMIAFTVAHRTRELGLRASLGADRRELVSLVLRQGLFVTTIGIVIGVAISLYATRFLESLLFETVPVDPVALTSTIVVLFTISMAAVYVPARRAMKIDPMVALRTE